MGLKGEWRSDLYVKNTLSIRSVLVENFSSFCGQILNFMTMPMLWLWDALRQDLLQIVVWILLTI